MATVLIVDDDIMIANVVRMLIKSAHPSAVIIHAEHGAHAWHIVNTLGKKPDIMITDVEMPEMDGVELAEKVRKNHPGIHVILMSGRPEPEKHRAKPASQKAHAFIGKPMARAKLLEMIKGVMEKP